MKKVYYLAEVTNGMVWKPEIGFYSQKEAEKYLKIKHYRLSDGENGWGIIECSEREDVKVYQTVNQYLIAQKREEIKLLEQEIEELENEAE